jgi:hypothetical protein
VLTATGPHVVMESPVPGEVASVNFGICLPGRSGSGKTTVVERSQFSLTIPAGARPVVSGGILRPATEVTHAVAAGEEAGGGLLYVDDTNAPMRWQTPLAGKRIAGLFTGAGLPGIPDGSYRAGGMFTTPPADKGMWRFSDLADRLLWVPAATTHLPDLDPYVRDPADDVYEDYTELAKRDHFTVELDPELASRRALPAGVSGWTDTRGIAGQITVVFPEQVLREVTADVARREGNLVRMKLAAGFALLRGACVTGDRVEVRGDDWDRAGVLVDASFRCRLDLGDRNAAAWFRRNRSLDTFTRDLDTVVAAARDGEPWFGRGGVRSRYRGRAQGRVDLALDYLFHRGQVALDTGGRLEVTDDACR